MQIIQIVIIIFALFVITRVLLRLRDNQLTMVEFMLWLFVWIAIMIFAFIPSLSNIFAGFLGIGRGVDFLIYLSLLLLFYMLFRVIVKMETIEHQITEIVRESALESDGKKAPRKRR